MMLKMNHLRSWSPCVRSAIT